MSNPTSIDRISSRPLKKSRRPLSPTSSQAASLTQLFANPTQEIPLPPSSGFSATAKRHLPPPPEIVTNVQGSSAGAGSGEFHVYKAARRREYERLRQMDEEVKAETEKEKFERERKEREERDAEKTRKNREKREKKKAKAKGKGGGGGSSTKGPVQAQIQTRTQKNGNGAGDKRDGGETKAEPGEPGQGSTVAVAVATNGTTDGTQASKTTTTVADTTTETPGLVICDDD